MIFKMDLIDVSQFIFQRSMIKQTRCADSMSYKHNYSFSTKPHNIVVKIT